jgi:hypothetical protein
MHIHFYFSIVSLYADTSVVLQKLPILGYIMLKTVNISLHLSYKREVQGLVHTELTWPRHRSATERDGVAATLYTHIGGGGVPTNLFRDTVCPDWGFRGFPHSLQANDEIIPLLGHYRFLPNSFQFIIPVSRTHSTLYSQDLDTDDIVKLSTSNHRGAYLVAT